MNMDLIIVKWYKFCVNVECYKKYIDSKLRVCHNKIVNGLVPTNVWLKRIGKRDTKECIFCKTADETLIHLLFTCHYVTQFWICVKQLFHTINFPMNITLYETMYGIIPNNTFDTKKVTSFYWWVNILFYSVNIRQSYLIFCLFCLMVYCIKINRSPRAELQIILQY